MKWRLLAIMNFIIFLFSFTEEVESQNELIVASAMSWNLCCERSSLHWNIWLTTARYILITHLFFREAYGDLD